MKDTINKTQMKTTPDNKSYWGEGGAYGKEYREFNDKLVPSCGDAPTVHGELVRCVGRLAYDFYYIGNCNIQDYDSWDCDDYGNPTDETEIFIKPYYQKMIDFIYQFSDAKEEVKRLEFFLTDFIHYNEHWVYDEKTPIYNALIDKVMYQVITEGIDGDKPNPEFVNHENEV